MMTKRKLTGVFELARAKLKASGTVAEKDIRTRFDVLKLVQKITGPCAPGDELKMLTEFLNKDAAPAKTTWRRDEYKLPREMRVAMQKSADHPRPLSMNAKFS